MSNAKKDSDNTEALLDGVAAGDARALDRLLDRHRDFLARVMAIRMEPALRRRVDPSDVVQETLMVAHDRVHDFLDRRPTEFRIWLRRKALERLVEHRRKHFAKKRDAARDISMADASSVLVNNLMSDHVSKSLIRRELQQQVTVSLEELSEHDREILLLRHAEELSNQEVASVLELDSKTASKRYGRALRRLSARLAAQGVSL